MNKNQVSHNDYKSSYNIEIGLKHAGLVMESLFNNMPPEEIEEKLNKFKQILDMKYSRPQLVSDIDINLN